MIYNTQKKKLIMPEYGRNIQNMVDHCVMLEDREERKRCAYAVVDIMGSMFPHLRDVNDFKHILWDHLAIMSDFKLDIDYPYEVVTREDLTTAPEKLNYSRPTMRFRHYGKLLERMIAIAADMEDGEKRDLLISQLTTQMKKSYSQWNKEVDDEKILADLVELSGGKIQLDYENYSIADVKNPASKRRLKTIKSQRRK
ncbi:MULTISPECIES: DUF4290 domain-containing protein [Petrimonas]|jgi:hypothetical protein|uniref:DUF4290 domain-containing protein n=1 Tax=Petrimonas mucosa TaxID=1642646 RepID=A0A1G4G6H4_9BACT|nr:MULTISPECIES: DUF4290 domain-containing protein [Petrimonas]MDD3560193.1 DUF4290 domain-containing protein [Petrimonas mucosa]SCM57397.1 putative protein {ECO:0000313/EMBL:CEA15158,1} [Petrimonas mucosa]SFU32950.1 protein of unknown function [Porphyromonadaceae bacterium KHP3R9]HHT29177.1 DUF4290 domain-containing protein [Petrimonas mucosa]